MGMDSLTREEGRFGMAYQEVQRRKKKVDVRDDPRWDSSDAFSLQLASKFARFKL